MPRTAASLTVPHLVGKSIFNSKEAGIGSILRLEILESQRCSDFLRGNGRFWTFAFIFGGASPCSDPRCPTRGTTAPSRLARHWRTSSASASGQSEGKSARRVAISFEHLRSLQLFSVANGTEDVGFDHVQAVLVMFAMVFHGEASVLGKLGSRDASKESVKSCSPCLEAGKARNLRDREPGWRRRRVKTSVVRI